MTDLKLTRPQIEALRKLNRDEGARANEAGIVWPLLVRLRARGLASSRFLPITDYPDRRSDYLWRITNAGRAALEALEKEVQDHD